DRLQARAMAAFEEPDLGVPRIHAPHFFAGRRSALFGVAVLVVSDPRRSMRRGAAPRCAGRGEQDEVPPERAHDAGRIAAPGRRANLAPVVAEAFVMGLSFP